MEFNQPKGIYLQIAEQVCDRILQGEWNDGDRIPSIRELAVNLGVNPNTVTRSYQSLLDRQIIENRRGIYPGRPAGHVQNHATAGHQH